MDSLQRLLLTGVQYLYGAHQQGARQAAANEGTSTHRRLKAAVTLGSKQNLRQAKRLEKVFKTLGVQPAGYPDEGMQGIIDANNALIARTTEPAERDLINIALGQTAAHFYLAKYGTMRTYAEELGNVKAAALLQKTLDETGKIDRKFTKLAHEVLAEIERSKTKTSAFGKMLSAVTGLGAIATLAASTLPLLGVTPRSGDAQS